jgi:hypothetical protein
VACVVTGHHIVSITGENQKPQLRQQISSTSCLELLATVNTPLQPHPSYFRSNWIIYFFSLSFYFTLIFSRANGHLFFAMVDSKPDRSWSDEPALLKLVHWYKLFDSTAPPRLGIDIDRRLPYAVVSAFSVGFGVGSSHGSKKAAFQFRAENAHRFPTTSTGWFQYHKTKNYKSIVGGVFEGVKLGTRLGVGAMAFTLFEETVDYARHDRRDFISTVIAGLSFSGIYSALGKYLFCLFFLVHFG